MRASPKCPVSPVRVSAGEVSIKRLRAERWTQLYLCVLHANIQGAQAPTSRNASSGTRVISNISGQGGPRPEKLHPTPSRVSIQRPKQREERVFYHANPKTGGSLGTQRVRMPGNDGQERGQWLSRNLPAIASASPSGRVLPLAMAGTALALVVVGGGQHSSRSYNPWRYLGGAM